MNKLITYSARILLSIFIGLCSVSSYLSGQTSNHPPPPGEDFPALAEKFLGPDQVLFNGVFPEPYIEAGQGHPYLGENKFYRGSIMIHNGVYAGLFLKYDLSDQKVIVTREDNDPESLQVVPPVDFISGFDISGKTFRKFRLESGEDRFYQVLYDGRIKCVCSFSKGKFRFLQSKLVFYGYTGEKRVFYLVDKGHFMDFSSVNSFLHYFPGKERSMIRDYIQKENIRFSRSSDEEIGRLMEFCAVLYQEDPLR